MLPNVTKSWQKSPKVTKNYQKSIPKVGNSYQKLAIVTKSWQKLPKVTKKSSNVTKSCQFAVKICLLYCLSADRID